MTLNEIVEPETKKYMIGRIWHGWTKPEHADKYERLLKSEILPGIAAKNIAGYKKIEVFRREHADETEFVTIMWFDSIESIKNFVGDDYEVAHVPDTAQEVLERWDERSQHYEIRQKLVY